MPTVVSPRVRSIFAELAGLSARKIAAELNARGVETPAGGKCVSSLGCRFGPKFWTHTTQRRRRFWQAESRAARRLLNQAKSGHEEPPPIA